MDAQSRKNRHDERAVKNTLFEALAHSTRRQVLRSLDAASGATTVSKLGRELAAREATGSLDDLPQRHSQQILLSLVHVHLPKLQAAGLIERTGDVVTLSETATSLPLSRPLDRGLLYESFTDRRKQV